MAALLKHVKRFPKSTLIILSEHCNLVMLYLYLSQLCPCLCLRVAHPAALGCLTSPMSLLPFTNPSVSAQAVLLSPPYDDMLLVHGSGHVVMVNCVSQPSVSQPPPPPPTPPLLTRLKIMHTMPKINKTHERYLEILTNLNKTIFCFPKTDRMLYGKKPKAA